MTTLKANKDNAMFIAEPIEQGSTESDWVSYKPSFKSVDRIVVDPLSTSTKLVSFSEPLPRQNDAVYLKDGVSNTLIAGILGTSEETVLLSASYDNVSFSVTAQDIYPYGIAFNNDGTKMFIMGNTNDSVFQYTLTTGFDLTTASYDNVSFSVTAQDTTPLGIAFNSDGTKMFMVGLTNDSVFQYTLTTGFDLTTASYDNVSFSVTAQDIYPYGIAFNNDGTKMFIMGYDNDSVFQYTLTTGFDLSTASYDNVSFSVGTQDTSPFDIAFNSDGTKMFMVDGTNSSVYQYTLTTGFDLSTASYDNVSFSVGTQDSAPYDIAFNSDGTKMFMVGGANDSVYQYTLKTSFNLISTGTSSDISTFNLSAAPTAASYQSLPVLFTSFTTTPARCVSQELPLDFVSATINQAIGESAQGPNAVIAGDDVVLYEQAGGNGSVVEATGVLEDVVGYGLVNASYDNVSFSIGAQDASPYGIAFNSDGTKMFMVGAANNSVFQYSLTTGFDLSTVSYDNVSLSVGAQDTTPFGIAFNTDGTKMFMVGAANDSVYQYSLTTGFDLSTASYDNVSFSVTSQDATPVGIAFNTDGTKMFMVGIANDYVHQYSLTTGFDLSTASYDNVSFSVATQDAIPYGIAFNSDGTKMFMVGVANDSVFQYTLTTGFDLSTASYDNVSLSVGAQDTTPFGTAFNNDGTKMFMLGYANDSVYQYTTESFSYTIDYATQTFTPVAVSIADRSTPHTTPLSQVWSGDVIETTYDEIGGGSNNRALQYKLTGDLNHEVTQINYALTKL